jgi:hypothetical protein
MNLHDSIYDGITAEYARAFDKRVMDGMMTQMVCLKPRCHGKSEALMAAYGGGTRTVSSPSKIFGLTREELAAEVKAWHNSQRTFAPLTDQRVLDEIRHSGTVTGRTPSQPEIQTFPIDGAHMNPQVYKQVEQTILRTERVEIASTKWFNAETHEPGQPGVFEVNPVPQYDTAEGDQRFSFFNGKSFGPVSPSTQGAYNARFEKSKLGSTITQFRGLVEQA